jgi:uncharacterized protein YaaR (DUF327 family)
VIVQLHSTYSLLAALVKSAQAAGRGLKRERNPADLAAAGESVVREFLKSAKGAARTPESIQEPIAPRSVLREFLKSVIVKSVTG